MNHCDVSLNIRTSSSRTLWECFFSNSLFSVWYFSIRSRISLIFELLISEFSFKRRSTSSFDFINPSASWLLSSCTKIYISHLWTVAAIFCCVKFWPCGTISLQSYVWLAWSWWSGKFKSRYKQQLVSVHYKINCESLDRLG